MDRAARAAFFSALGDETRLAVVDLLAGSGDLTFREVASDLGIPGNLLAHHLATLESVGLIERRVSEGDHRRRYLILRWDRLRDLYVGPPLVLGSVLFVCSHNSARSQYAAARWQQRTGGHANSAGSEPLDRVHPVAIRVAAERGVDLSRGVPVGYDTVPGPHGLVVSVCDRARETGLPEAGRYLHWSIPDPVARRGVTAFREAFGELDDRIETLATRIARGA
ncbi:MAG: helix-turn-helix domain-containing protein [Actinobacteria bacterium]|nr:helix-turn-helix domain-containing protein [Actinomycetota bacterium]MCI0543016.1 helix-turn-helix domain-containing protein [Actinomycetota bacterium]MCI0677764.1 helix-turn-helix domain-containing protein [Actinomycetota bacterium]